MAEKAPQKGTCPFCQANLWFRQTVQCRKCKRHLRRRDDGTIICYATKDEFMDAANRMIKKHAASLKRLGEHD